LGTWADGDVCMDVSTFGQGVHERLAEPAAVRRKRKRIALEQYMCGSNFKLNKANLMFLLKDVDHTEEEITRSTSSDCLAALIFFIPTHPATQSHLSWLLPQTDHSAVTVQAAQQVPLSNHSPALLPQQPINSTQTQNSSKGTTQLSLADGMSLADLYG